MAKNILPIILITLTTFSAFAQEQADTLKTHELNEVVVQAELQSMVHNKASYIPTKQQRNASINGIAVADTCNFAATSQYAYRFCYHKCRKCCGILY